MDTDEKLKEIQSQIDSLIEKRDSIEDEKENDVKRKIIKVGYWQSRQDYYFVSEHETFHVADYVGGGGLTISQGIDSNLIDIRNLTIKKDLTPSSKEIFYEKLIAQVNRIDYAIVEPRKPSWKK